MLGRKKAVYSLSVTITSWTDFSLDFKISKSIFLYRKTSPVRGTLPSLSRTKPPKVS